MERETDRNVAEFHSLTGKIRAESAALKKVMLSESEEQELGGILQDFDNTIQAQVFSTLDHLSAYQLYEWREQIDGGDDSKNGE